MGNRIGYARVSTKEQNIDSQLDQLAKAGCVKVITDTIGGTTKDRPGWNELMEWLGVGAWDTLSSFLARGPHPFICAG